MSRLNDVVSEELENDVVLIKKVTKVVKGGRNFRFSVLVIVGNRGGFVGYGLGKGKEVNEAVSNGILRAKKQMIRVFLTHETIPYEIHGKCGCSEVFLKPARQGTGIIAGSGVRVVCKYLGLRNVLSKCIKGNNITNIVKATFDALSKIKNPVCIAKERGMELNDIYGVCR